MMNVAVIELIKKVTLSPYIKVIRLAGPVDTAEILRLMHIKSRVRIVGWGSEKDVATVQENQTSQGDVESLMKYTYLESLRLITFPVVLEFQDKCEKNLDNYNSKQLHKYLIILFKICCWNIFEVC